MDLYNFILGLFPIQVSYTSGYTKALIAKPLFALRASELGLISSMRLDDRKDIQSVQSD